MTQHSPTDTASQIKAAAHDSGIRRDPRHEWILRNRLHPRHKPMVAAQYPEERGPSGLLRKNPHAIGFTGPNGLKRIDRLAGSGLTSSTVRRGKTSTSEEQLPLVQVTAPTFYIAVVPDCVGGYLSSHDKDVLGQAQAFVHQINLAQGYTADHGGAVVAIIFGKINATDMDTAGIDRLIHLSTEDYQGFCPESQLAALLRIDAQLSPTHWLLPDSVHGGFDRGCRLAAALHERPATQVWKADANTLTARVSGAQQDCQRNTPRLLMLSEECHLPVDETRHEVISISLEQPTVLSKRQIHDQGTISVDPSSIPLAEAPFILSGGNGISDWDQFHTAAQALGASEGASRVAVDDGFMPRDRQVGATGTWVTADMYLAIGISGAIQHMQGIGQCRTVIAVNTDANCDMVKRADLSLICESQALLDALLSALRVTSTPANSPSKKDDAHAA